MLAAGCLIAAISSGAIAQDVPAEPTQLLLEVRINGARSPLLWQFLLLPDGGLATSAQRLQDLGFLLPQSIPRDSDTVRLADLPGVTYHYVEASQSIEIDAADEAIVPIILDAGSIPQPLHFDRITRSTGAVFNYGIYTQATPDEVLLSGQYDARLFTRRGVIFTAGYVDWNSDHGKADHVRLDTYYRLLDVRRVLALTVGDTIGDGGQLSSAYRLGGIQLRRDFAERSDLVTTAVPILNGSAAVPSTIDLYINGIQRFTGEVGRGPFQFRSLPSLGSGAANTTIVLTDAAGRQTRIEKPIFFVPSLLPKGMLDFSAEVGFPRLNFGTDSFRYLNQIAMSGSLSYGLTDALTVRGHVERMSDLINGSVGGTMRIGQIAALTAGLAASHFEGETGIRYLLSAQTTVAGIDLYGSIERADSNYQNIVTVTSARSRTRSIDPLPETEDEDHGSPILSAFSRRTERVGASFSFLNTGFNLSYARLRLPEQNLRLANFSVSRTVASGIALWGSGYKGFGDRNKDYGFAIGISASLGPGTWGSASASHSNDGTRISSRLSHSTGTGEGSWNFSVANTETVSGAGDSFRAADARYQGRNATLGAGIAQRTGGGRNEFRLTAFAEGAAVVMGDVFLAPSIDRSFAVVRGAGADTPVLVNRREVTRTNAKGSALIPSLISLAANDISIDPSNLPIDLKPARTQIEIVPDDRAGVIVDFGVAPDEAALVVLVDGNGAFLPVGSRVFRGEGEMPITVGYDGRVYLTNLASHNRIQVQLPEGGTCSAEFDFVPVSGEQVLIGPLPCQ